MNKPSGRRAHKVEAHRRRDADRGARATRLTLALARQDRLVHALAESLACGDGTAPRHLETHISHVLLHGGFAYKIKKALATPFLDQSTLALRRRACREELRLNRRLAPDLYLGVVAITGTHARPVLGGKGRALEVAVKMRAFDQAGLWDQLAAGGELGAADVDELAEVLVRFHAQAAAVTDTSALGTPARQHVNLTDTLAELGMPATPGTSGDAWPDAAARATLADLASWADATYARLAPVMARRRTEGRVRECHGDLHLGNVARERGHCLVFDGIEFNEHLRWIDVMSDVAFIAMDLEAHALPALAHRLVNAYLEAGGDYDGVRVLRYHEVYRALVRAKVALMRAAQTGRPPPDRPRAGVPPGGAADAVGVGVDAARLDALASARRYLGLASRTAQPPRDAPLARLPAALLITHGLSGSGKTTLGFGLVEAMGAVRVRADVERKRLAGLEPLASSRSVAGGGLYRPDANAATYARLFDAAAGVLEGGRTALLDATFLRHADRVAAQRLAAAHGVPFVILCFEAAPEILRERVRRRAALGRDASEADENVLALQLRQHEPLRPDEAGFAYLVPPGADAATPRVDWAPLVARLRLGGFTPP